MSKKSMSDCLKTNDFEEAVYRWSHTTKNWASRWFDVCYQIFQQSKEWSKKYLIDPVKKIISKIQTPVESVQKGNYFYLMRMFDETGRLVFSKIGTTTRTIQQRMKEHYKSYKKLGITNIICDREYNCGEIPPECLESYFRACYIKKYPNAYVKNDRFFNVEFDLQQADEMFNFCINNL